MSLRLAKERILLATTHEPWLVGVGIGLVGEPRSPGIIVSVSEEGRAAAERLVENLDLDVPVLVRVAGPITKRDDAVSRRRSHPTGSDS